MTTLEDIRNKIGQGPKALYKSDTGTDFSLEMFTNCRRNIAYFYSISGSKATFELEQSIDESNWRQVFRDHVGTSAGTSGNVKQKKLDYPYVKLSGVGSSPTNLLTLELSAKN